MASSLSLDERAVIMAPTQLATDTAALLANAGITCLCTGDIDKFEAGLAEGAGLAIIAQNTLDTFTQDGLHAFIKGQPSWSDLPIVMITQVATTATTPCDHPLGNLTLLVTPYEETQLVQLSQTALRNRRRQYQARDQLSALQYRVELDTRSEQEHISEMALQQTRKMEAIGQLAGGVAHDFNNLLTSIGGSFELIDRRLKQGRTQGLESVLHMGREAVSRASRLTHRLLAFSSRQSLHSQRIDLQAMLQAQKLDARYTVNLHLDLANDLWPVQADQGQLQEALENLLLNACEAMPNGGDLSIKARNQPVEAEDFAGSGLANGDYACLSIIDDGQGMSQGTLEHAFEPFFSTKPIGQGIGLGLSMVYGFSKQSHGHVLLKSQIGQGTQVDLYLPRHLDQPKPHPALPVPQPESVGRHVLLVEDDYPVRQLLTQALQDYGFICQSVGSAAEALQLLQSSQPIDLLVSDVGLPGMNGRQLAEIARKLKPHLPVLFITGYAETAMSREGFLGPGMQMIGKPFELKHLQERVKLMLGKH
ncbi:response regulator [Pseudomonas sp. PSKL.D1]|uniref:response regulator n=1 Tax=Pseudomonas sp. PSKL.D1 TaxID=3029060 RepID=UPI002381549B|nr:response regulator [Pseudomonas sp. PSKL.D1]WDY60141.1 response regulator [Pseudomonas sp. PSKL.D1]